MTGTWKKLSAGSYNLVYRSPDNKFVLKIAFSGDKYRTDAPRRAVRLWNEVNPNLPKAKLHQDPKRGLGWISAYIPGRQSTDQEIHEKLIDIFNKTGRIVIDATSRRNFLTTKDKAHEVICVDVGMALLLTDAKEENSVPQKRSRRHSNVSLAVWQELQGNYQNYFKAYKKKFPKTIKTIQALLFITIKRPDIYDVTFLKNNLVAINTLANGYNAEDVGGAIAVLNNILPTIQIRANGVAQAENILDDEREVNLCNLQDSCKNELNKFISSRGKINNSNEPKLSLLTKMFSNNDVIRAEMMVVHRLIGDIDKSSSIKEIAANIAKIQEHEKAALLKDLKPSLIKCMQFVEVVQKTAFENNSQHLKL